jgi:hypothetical protein
MLGKWLYIIGYCGILFNFIVNRNTLACDLPGEKRFLFAGAEEEKEKGKAENFILHHI